MADEYISDLHLSLVRAWDRNDKAYVAWRLRAVRADDVREVADLARAAGNGDLADAILQAGLPPVSP